MTRFTAHAYKAAADARECPEPDPLKALQEWLWSRLADARRHAANGDWSIGCDGIVNQIAQLTLHTQKPTGNGSVPTELVLDGIYEAIHEGIGSPTPLSAEDRARHEEHLAWLRRGL